MKYIKYWANFGLSKQHLQANLLALDRTNLLMLRNICLLGSVFMFIAIYFRIIVNKSWFISCMSLVISLIFFVMFFIYNNALKKNETNHRFIHYSSLALIVFTIFFAIYSGTIMNRDMAGTGFLIVITCMGFVFIISPIEHFICSFFGCIAFCIVSIIYKDSSVYIYDIFNSGFCLIFATVITWLFVRVRLKELIGKKEMMDHNEVLHRLSTIDELTGIPNRRSLIFILDKYIKCSTNSTFMVCGLMVDIDYFKEYNDLYGHIQGDKVLSKLGSAINAFGLEYDMIVGRLGGEEFLAIWLSEDACNYENIAEGFRKRVEQLHIPHENSSISKYLTVSVGACNAKKGEQITTEEFLNRGDEALYRAKDNGRNCVCCH